MIYNLTCPKDFERAIKRVEQANRLGKKIDITIKRENSNGFERNRLIRDVADHKNWSTSKTIWQWKFKICPDIFKAVNPKDATDWYPREIADLSDEEMKAAILRLKTWAESVGVLPPFV